MGIDSRVKGKRQKVNDPKKYICIKMKMKEKYLNKEIEKLKCRLCMYLLPFTFDPYTHIPLLLLRSYHRYLTIDDLFFLLLIVQLTMIFNPLTLHLLFLEMKQHKHNS